MTTVLHWISNIYNDKESDFFYSVCQLLCASVDSNIQEPAKGRTPLHCFCAVAAKDIVLMLMQLEETDVMREDDDGVLALQLYPQDQLDFLEQKAAKLPGKAKKIVKAKLEEHKSSCNKYTKIRKH